MGECTTSHFIYYLFSDCDGGAVHLKMTQSRLHHSKLTKCNSIATKIIATDFKTVNNSTKTPEHENYVTFSTKKTFQEEEFQSQNLLVQVNNPLLSSQYGNHFQKNHLQLTDKIGAIFFTINFKIQLNCFPYF